MEQPVGRKEPNRKQSEETKQSRWGFRGKTVWDFLQLLIVPLALAVVGFLFTMQQDVRQQHIEDERARQARNKARLEWSKAHLLRRGALFKPCRRAG